LDPSAKDRSTGDGRAPWARFCACLACGRRWVEMSSLERVLPRRAPAEPRAERHVGCGWGTASGDTLEKTACQTLKSRFLAAEGVWACKAHSPILKSRFSVGGKGLRARRPRRGCSTCERRLGGPSAAAGRRAPPAMPTGEVAGGESERRAGPADAPSAWRPRHSEAGRRPVFRRFLWRLCAFWGLSVRRRARVDGAVLCIGLKRIRYIACTF